MVRILISIFLMKMSNVKHIYHVPGPPEGMKVTDLNNWKRKNVEFAVKEKGFQCPPEALKVENSEYTV